MTSVWGMYPFPTMTGEQLQDGCVSKVPSICSSCRDRPCGQDARAALGEPRQCKYGMTYARIDDERIVLGVVATDLPMVTKRARKLARNTPELRVRAADLISSIGAVRSLGTEVIHDFKLTQQELLQDLRQSPEMHDALASKLRRDFDANLDQSHDFLQLVKLVRGHTETLLLQTHPDLDVVPAAEREPNLGAIYFSTELMLAKMDSLVFLRDAERAARNLTTFQVHPYVLKYVRIYDWQARQKDVQLRVTGSSFGRVTLNSDAVGAVIQGLLDNLIKYAPAGSSAAVEFNENDTSICVEFVSLGPRIAPEEVDQIFLAGFRAEAAKKSVQSGLGVGLATAREISNVLDLQLTVAQDELPDPKYALRFLTRFTFVLPRTS